MLLFLGTLSTASDASFVFVRSKERDLVSIIAPPQSLLFLFVNSGEREREVKKPLVCFEKKGIKIARSQPHQL